MLVDCQVLSPTARHSTSNCENRALCSAVSVGRPRVSVLSPGWVPRPSVMWGWPVHLITSTGPTAEETEKMTILTGGLASCFYVLRKRVNANWHPYFLMSNLNNSLALFCHQTYFNKNIRDSLQLCSFNQNLIDKKLESVLKVDIYNHLFDYRRLKSVDTITVKKKSFAYVLLEQLPWVHRCIVMLLFHRWTCHEREFRKSRLPTLVEE